MLALLKVASGLEPFGSWLKHSESISSRRTEKLDSYLEVLYVLLEDVLRLTHGVSSVRNDDVRADLEALSRRVSFDWVRSAVRKVDELVELVRRNIQKSLALDALAVELRSGSAVLSRNEIGTPAFITSQGARTWSPQTVN